MTEKSLTKKETFFSSPTLLTQIKQRIRMAQERAVMAANAEMISMYWRF